MTMLEVSRLRTCSLPSSWVAEEFRDQGVTRVGGLRHVKVPPTMPWICFVLGRLRGRRLPRRCERQGETWTHQVQSHCTTDATAAGCEEG